MPVNIYSGFRMEIGPPQAVVGLRLGIGITTKDRWDDLFLTLSELQKNGFDEVETVVIDDGSKRSLPRVFRTAFPKVRFERVENSLGLVAQRNRLARLLNSTYYLSLDDDSFPVAGDLGEGVDWLDDHPSVIALAFHIVRPDEPIPQDPGEPFPVKYFIGCGHLVRRKEFLQLGGYLERLHQYAEEDQFCLNALLRGFSTYAYPAVVIRHNKTRVARNSARATRYYIRNQAILGFLYFPFPFSAVRVLNCLRLLGNPEWNSHPVSLLQGWLEALGCLITWRKLRRPLSLAQFLAWKRLPSAKQ